MIPKGLFHQIFILVAAGVIAFTYLQPAFIEIGEIQDEIADFDEKREGVTAVNNKLATLRSQMKSITTDDALRLARYLPDAVDEIRVARELYLISMSTGVLFQGVTYQGIEDNKRKTSRISEKSETDMPIPHEFALVVGGTYNQIKELVGIFEENDYPLVIKSLNIDTNEGGYLTASFSLITYALSELPE